MYLLPFLIPPYENIPFPIFADQLPLCPLRNSVIKRFRSNVFLPSLLHCGVLNQQNTPSWNEKILPLVYSISPFNFTHKSQKFSLNVVAFLSPYFTKFLDVFAKSVRYAFLDFCFCIRLCFTFLASSQTRTIRLSQSPVSMAIRILHPQNELNQTGTKPSPYTFCLPVCYWPLSSIVLQSIHLVD